MAEQRMWTSEEKEFLRRNYGQIPTQEIADRLGRTHLGVKQTAYRLGLNAKRRHTSLELDMVKKLYPTHTASQIAVALYGESTPKKLSRVMKMADKLGIKKLNYWSEAELAAVKQLHSEGLTDGQIARRLPESFVEGPGGRLQVRAIRVRFGLTANRDTEESRRMQLQGVSSQLRTLGLKNVAELRSLSHRRFAARYGLPEDLRLVQVRIILALIDGPLNLAELMQAIGAKPTSKLIHNGTGGTYQADLVNRGLVSAIPIGKRGTARGARVLFTLTGACLELLSSAQQGKSE